MLRALVFSFVLAFAGQASAAEWLCVPERATGFRWDGTEWTQATFNVDNETYVVAEIPPRKDYSGRSIGLEVTQTGKEFFSFECPAFVEGYNQTACGGLGMGFIFNRSTLRFQQLYGIGFVGGEDGPDNTPFLQIGRCTKLPPRN